MLKLAVCAALALSTVFSHAQNTIPKELKETINGFEVTFVDIGRGDTFGAAFFTPHGTLHDQGKMLGRAHLLEHLLFTGTKEFPGYHTFDQTLKPAGVEYNAYTSDDVTYYHSAGKAKNAELIIRAQLSMLGGLEWNPEVYVKERDVVINEIAQENNKKDAYAPHYMALTKLMPPGHPWAEPKLGDDPNLRAMEIPHLREAYMRNYTPKDVKVVLFGNFTDPNFLTQVKTWTGKYLKTFPAEGELPPAPAVPSLFSAKKNAPESQRALYIASSELKSGAVEMEAHLVGDGIDRTALSLLVSYLDLQAPGSIIYKLKSELGWASDAGFRAQIIGTKVHFYFWYDLTEEGGKHIAEINEMLFTTLRNVRDLDANILNMMKEDYAVSWSRASRSVNGLLRSYVPALKEGVSIEEMIAKMKAVTPQALEKTAAAFRPDHALYQQMGPEIPGMKEDPIFVRKYSLLDNKAAVAKLMKIRNAPATKEFRPVLTPVNLGFESTPLKVQRWSETGSSLVSPAYSLMDIRQDLPDNAASLVFRVAPMNSRSPNLVAADLKYLAFVERHMGELNYIDLKYQVNLGIERTANEIAVQAAGENSFTVPALKWLVRSYAAFKPTEQEWERARQKYMESLKVEYSSQFTGAIGIDELQQLMDPHNLSLSSRYHLAKALKIDEASQKAEELMGHSDRHVYMVGALNPAESESLMLESYRLSPEALSSQSRLALNDRFPTVSSTTEEKQTFAFPKGETSYSLSRSYKGPSATELFESAAFLVLNSVIAENVNHHNRGDRGLGYIHTSLPRAFGGKNHYLTFIGQTDGVANAQLTMSGWQDVMDWFKSGKITDEEIERSIHGVRNQLSQQKTSASQILASYRTNATMRLDPKADEKLLAALADIKPAHVREIANRYLFTDPPPPSMQLTIGDCEALLAGGMKTTPGGAPQQ